MLSSDLDINAGPPLFNLNARTMLSFSDFNAWLAPAFDRDIAITANRRIGFVHAVFCAGWSNATLVAYLRSACGRGKHACSCESGCQGQRVGCSHLALHLFPAI
jgi:hypothetical protein